jgi:hypothetical protein
LIRRQLHGEGLLPEGGPAVPALQSMLRRTAEDGRTAPFDAIAPLGWARAAGIAVVTSPLLSAKLSLNAGGIPPSDLRLIARQTGRNCSCPISD